MKTILVATDFSETASHAAYYAVSMAMQIGIPRIILYHSYDIPYVSSDLPLPEPDNIQQLHEKSVEFLEYLKNDLLTVSSRKIRIEAHTNEHPLALAIETFIEEEDIELVVMGTTGKSRIEKILVGSNCLSLAKECTVPLLLVPFEAPVERIKRVALATDLKEVAEISPVMAIKTFVHTLQAKLFILNVEHNESDHYSPDIIAQQTALHKLWDSENPEYHFTDHKDCAAGIMDFVEERDIQLVIAIPKKYSFFQSLFHRSVTEKLAYHSHIPLLFIRKTELID